MHVYLITRRVGEPIAIASDFGYYPVQDNLSKVLLVLEVDNTAHGKPTDHGAMIMPMIMLVYNHGMVHMLTKVVDNGPYYSDVATGNNLLVSLFITRLCIRQHM
jgi:hypothetical protein